MFRGTLMNTISFVPTQQLFPRLDFPINLSTGITFSMEFDFMKESIVHGLKWGVFLSYIFLSHRLCDKNIFSPF